MMKKIWIALAAFCSISAAVAGSASPNTIMLGKKAIEQHLPQHIFWVEFEDDTSARFRALNYHEVTYNLDELTSHNYFLKIRLKPIDNPSLATMDCETDVYYDYKSKDISYTNALAKWCEPLQY